MCDTRGVTVLHFDLKCSQLLKLISATTACRIFLFMCVHINYNVLATEPLNFYFTWLVICRCAERQYLTSGSIFSRTSDLDLDLTWPLIELACFARFWSSLDRSSVVHQVLTVAPVMRYEMTLVHVLMFISFLNLTSINTVRTKIKVRVFYK